MIINTVNLNKCLIKDFLKNYLAPYTSNIARVLEISTMEFELIRCIKK